MTDHGRGSPVQRTDLAWRRTGLAALGLAAIALRAAASHHDLATVLTSTLGLATAIACYLIGRGRTATAAPSPWSVVAVAAGTTACALVALIAAVTAR